MQARFLDKLRAINAFSFLAIFLAIISLLAGIAPKVYHGFKEEPNKAEVTIGQVQITMQAYSQEKTMTTTNWAYASLGLSTLAFLCCVFGFITHENKRVYISALVIIALSLGWNFL